MVVSDQDRGSRARFPDSLSDRTVHLVIGLLAGLAVYGLVDSADWLAERTWIVYPLWLLALGWPTILMLGYSREHYLRGLAWVSGIFACLAALALYTGWQALVIDESRGGVSEFVDIVLGFPFAQSMLVVCFVATIHLQPVIWGKECDYDTLFALSWRNFLTIGLATLLTLCVWGVLWLWGGLFESIGIEFFADLFDENWFLYPTLGISFALGVHSFGTLPTIIDRVTTLITKAIRVLFPLVALAITCFLVTLPFTGLDPLWATRSGTATLIAANLWGLFLLNVVYRTGGRLPYPRALHRILSAAVFLYPVLAALSLYGLVLRVAQYGWTPNRCMAMLIIVLMALFSLGYAVIVCWRRDDWSSNLPGINRRMSWVVLASLLVTASPLLDFRSVSAWSQFSRIESGEVLVEDLDLDDIDRELLGRPGRVKLQALLESLDESDPQAALALRERLVDEERTGWGPRQQARIVMRPERFEVPLNLAEKIDGYNTPKPDLLFRVDLGGGEATEVVAVWVEARGKTESLCLTWRNGEWVSCGRARIYVTGRSREDLLHELSTADYTALVPQTAYKRLRVGELVLGGTE